MPQVAVTFSTPPLHSAAAQLAEKLHYPLVFSSNDPSFEYFLVLTPEGLALQPLDSPHTAAFLIDFLSPSLRYRSKHASRRNEILARALGLKNNTSPLIVDATAGLGRDSFILASLGFDVILLERSLLIFALLEDGLQRAQQHPSTAPIIKHLRLFHANAISWLKETKTVPDIIYLDPMFPEKSKKALAKKEMQIFQRVLGADSDSDALFETALTCAKQRVVVKRPRLASPLCEKTPSFSLKGSSCRFDVYLTIGQQAWNSWNS